MTATPTIFLSYSWSNSTVADEIDKDFQVTGITLNRDIRDVGYKGNIKEFMKTINRHDYVVVLVSNEFIRSANCMYEIMELLQNPDFKEKILPVLVPGTKIFQPKDRADVLQYWQGKRTEALELLKGLNPTQAASIQDDLKHYANICDNVDSFLAYIKDTNCLNLENLKSSNYKPMFDLIGINDQAAAKLEELIKIIEIEEEEDQQIAIDNYIANYPSDYLGWFAKGYINQDPKRAKYKVSKNAYEKALAINPQYANAHNNYAIILKNHFKDYRGAKEHYEKSLEINSQQADANNNYAILLEVHFDNYDGAKEYYVKAVEINPQDAKIHYNYAGLLHAHFKDYEGAKEHYEKAVEINPQYAEAYTNYAYLLKDHFDDTETAKQHYLKAVEINPTQKTLERDAYFGVDT